MNVQDTDKDDKGWIPCIQILNHTGEQAYDGLWNVTNLLYKTELHMNMMANPRYLVNLKIFSLCGTKFLKLWNLTVS